MICVDLMGRNNENKRIIPIQDGGTSQFTNLIDFCACGKAKLFNQENCCRQSSTFAANSCRGFIFPEREKEASFRRESFANKRRGIITNFRRTSSLSQRQSIMQIMDWIPLYEIKLWKIYTLRFHARQILWNDTNKTLWNSKTDWDHTRRSSSRSADVLTTERDIKRTLSCLNASALCA